jgi:hypothetical protein
MVANLKVSIAKNVLRNIFMLRQEPQFEFADAPEAAESKVLFGPPALLPAESPAEYWRLYSLLQADLAPRCDRKDMAPRLGRSPVGSPALAAA